MTARRLPVGPRPYRDELLSSWLGRVASRYGLDAAGLVGALVADGESDARGIPIDDAAPPRENIACWAQACGVDPERLSRLTLARRRPERPTAWFLSQGPPWAPTAMRSPPVCCACFEDDRAAGRDDHLRADWMLAERCVCPAHRRLLRDSCPRCRPRLRLVFRLREGRARLVCGRCDQELAAQTGSQADDGALIDALISLQDRIGAVVRGPSQRRKRLEEAVSTLWAPLDDPGAARPALALWIDESGWRCPAEAQQAIGASFPLGRLSISWRVATLIAFNALFGVEDDGADAATRDRLARHAAFASRKGVTAAPRMFPSLGRPKTRIERDYPALARQILAHPDWTVAAALPENRRSRVLARLMDAALASRLSNLSAQLEAVQ
jgi:hypothetical protein